MHARRAADRVVNVRAILAAIPIAVEVNDCGDGETRAVHGARGCRAGALRAWSRDVGNATHHLVLEDDAQPCERFAELAVEAVERAPDAVILYFYSGVRLCSVATSMPTSLVPRWLAWVEASPIPHHDLLLACGARALGVPLLYTAPSLVEHGGFASLLGHHDNVKADRFRHDPTHFELIPR